MTEFQTQKAAKPTPEEMINQLVKAEHRQTALDFIAHIRAIKMTPSWASINSWKCSYKSKGVVYIKIDSNGDWWLQPFTQRDMHLKALVADEPDEIKAYVEQHLGRYTPCGGCMPGLDRHTVNQEWKNICAVYSLNMKNPDDGLCEFAKRLIMLRRDAVACGRVPKCNYVKPGDRV